MLGVIKRYMNKQAPPCESNETIFSTDVVLTTASRTQVFNMASMLDKIANLSEESRLYTDDKVTNTSPCNPAAWGWSYTLRNRFGSPCG